MTDQLGLFGKSELATLYKLTVTNSIQTWRTWVDGSIIHTEHGKLNGKLIHDTETVKSGTNIGRANARTPEQQAEFMAKATWTKKRENGYYLTTEEAMSHGEGNRCSKAGGYNPMLAHVYASHADRMVFPCYIQPKLDGLRMVSTSEQGVRSGWFRGGKRVETVDHIIKELNLLFKPHEILDGELYQHREDFNKFTGKLRAKTNTDDTTNIKYCIYDCPKIGDLVETDSFERRHAALVERFLFAGIQFEHIELVETYLVHTEEIAMNRYAEFIKQHYEGGMLRNCNMPYVQKRSYDLLKLKEFQDSEFKIVDFVEGKGKLEGTVGAFVCETGDGSRFNCKLSGDHFGLKNHDYLRKLFNNPDEFLGRQLTVQYFGMSGDSIPRFPVGKTIRWDDNDE